MSQLPRPASELAALLLARDPLPPLVPPGVYDEALTEEIAATTGPATVKAGLYLLNDDLPRAHALAQSVEGDPLGDYWHALIHRREGDYDNARYWFGRVGPLPILAQIYGPDPNAPKAFVERCRAARGGTDVGLEQFQRDEMAHLLEYVLGREHVTMGETETMEAVE